MTTTAAPGSRQAHREASERDKHARRFLLRLSLANWGVAVVAWTVSAFLGITSPASIIVYSVLFVIGLVAVVVALVTYVLEKFAHTPEQLASADAEARDADGIAGAEDDTGEAGVTAAAAPGEDVSAKGEPVKDDAPKGEPAKGEPRQGRPPAKGEPPAKGNPPPRATLRLPPRADRDSSGVPGSVSPSKPALFARLVKIEHSIFALPFAYAGAFLAADGMPTWAQLVWITVAMVGARSAAMALNRLIDAELDARNPRTATRELPAGRLGRREVWLFTAVSVALLVVAAFQLSEPCRYLWPIPLAAFVLYPYAKRFTWFCHYALGLTLGLAPAAAWLAVRGTLGPVPWLLFFAVGLWVGGFDVIYAIFDLDFDRRSGLHSVPVALGARGALIVAALSHVATVTLLVAVGSLSDLGAVYWIGLAAVAALLAWPHVDIARRGLDRVGMGFMSVNGAVGLLYGAVVIVATLWS